MGLVLAADLAEDLLESGQQLGLNGVSKVKWKGQRVKCGQVSHAYAVISHKGAKARRVRAWRLMR